MSREVRDDHSTIPSRQATSQDVLAIFIDSHRQQVHYDDMADPKATLSGEMSIAKWREACDLVEVEKLGPALNQWFGTMFDQEQWRAALVPEESRTLGEVCQLIASSASVPEIRPVNLLGKPCMAAGAFFNVRALLEAAGADVSDLAPSSPLDPYLRNWWPVFLIGISKMAPGRLPCIRIETPFYDRTIIACGLAFFLSVPVGLISIAFLGPWLAAASAIVAVIAWRLTYIAARVKPHRVTLGDLQTFRELCCMLAGTPDLSSSTESRPLNPAP